MKGERAAKVAADASLSLNAQDWASISQYRGAVSTGISKALRIREPMPSRLQDVFDGILAAFDRVKMLGKAVVAFRGISTAALPSNLVGMTIKDQGIVTTALQVGIVTAVFGAPVFIFLVRRRKMAAL